MVDMTKQEIVDIDDLKKWLTIRSFTKKGHMPFRIGTETFLKIGRTKERYGLIRMTEAEIKPLSQMTDVDAFAGGYTSRDDYISDHLTKFNSDCDLDEPMIFYRFEIVWMDSDLVNKLRMEIKAEL